jgi:hypothetical protein
LLEQEHGLEGDVECGLVCDEKEGIDMFAEVDIIEGKLCKWESSIDTGQNGGYMARGGVLHFQERGSWGTLHLRMSFAGFFRGRFVFILVLFYLNT